MLLSMDYLPYTTDGVYIYQIMSVHEYSECLCDVGKLSCENKAAFDSAKRFVFVSAAYLNDKVFGNPFMPMLRWVAKEMRTFADCYLVFDKLDIHFVI